MKSEEDYYGDQVRRKNRSLFKGLRFLPPGTTVESGEKGRVQGSLRVQSGQPGAEKLSTIAVKGFQGTSLLDFPGRVASLIFTGGCNLTCPFCHNPGLVLDPGAFPDFPVNELLADLKKRQSFIDGVVISGGEPTLDTGLPAFLRQLKELGLQVKLDTNGLLPEVIHRLLDEQLLDYLAVDIKTTPDRYGELHTRPVSSAPLLRTIELVKAAAIETEFRTTCVPQLVGEDELRLIGELLRGAPLWVLQQFLPEHSLVVEWQELSAYPPGQLERLGQVAEGYVERVLLRGL